MPGGTAVVAGVSGIVGRAIAGRLLDDGWRVVGVSRRAPDPAIPGLEHMSLDLGDRSACHAALAGLAATHAIYAGRAPDPDPVAEARRNAAMLVNLVEGLEAGSAPLSHVLLVHGSKWYGSHLGPYLNPATEDSPRAPGANFYFDQQDWVAGRVAGGAAWNWTALRPHILAGYSVGYPHNAIGVLAAYAALARERGGRLTFPGTREGFESLSQLTDLGLLVDAMAWAMTAPQAAGEAFNVINADCFRWRDVWPLVADWFGIDAGGVATEALAETHRNAGVPWRAMAAARNLAEPDVARVANWGYGDFMFRIGWDDLTSTVKIRQASFANAIGTWESIRNALQAYRDRRVIE